MEPDKLHHSSLINTPDTDFRAELVVAGLIECGADAGKILIVRERGDKRNVSKDISRIESGYSDYDLTEYLYIYTNRPGIYDSLPEGIFHLPDNAGKQRTKEDIIREIRDHRDEEFFARRYFRPFEIVLDQVLTDARMYEQKFDKACFYGNLRDIFINRWNILRYLSLKQALLFIRVIPVMAEVSQSPELMSKVMEIILDCPVQISEGKKTKKKLPDEKKIPLGTWKLGINSILGDSVSGDNTDLVISIGPLSTEKMKLFESNAVNRLILNELIDLVIPFDRNVSVKYKLSDADIKFRLSDKTRKAYLGINTGL
ncbi:MAG: type VI secretion system baseplate subunit TssG [Candidatus Azobacteroides sp.]|nr:type VI secretion system baseplate subunit TssG [Candidatus Azobacteroides sp.]